MTLAAKLAQVIGATSAVEKKGDNEGQRYKYQRAADVANEVRGHLAKLGVAFLLSIDSKDLQILPRGDGKAPLFFFTVQGTARFIDGETGEEYLFGVAGTGEDYGGGKGLYKAITGALKYALRTAFLIPDIADDPEVDDPDGATPPGASITVIGATALGTETADKLANDRQKAHLRATAREKGLDGGAFKAFVFAVAGKATSKDLTVADYEHLIAFLSGTTPEQAEMVRYYSVWTGEVAGDTVA